MEEDRRAGVGFWQARWAGRVVLLGRYYEDLESVDSTMVSLQKVFHVHRASIG